MTSTKDGRFRIDHHQRSDDSYMSSYTSYSWSVFSVELDEELVSFSGSWDANANGEAKTGTCAVKFSDDESELVVRDYDGTEAHVPLPVAFRLSEDERFLIGAHRDGRETQTALYMEYDDNSAGVPRWYRPKLRKREAERVARLKVALAKAAATRGGAPGPG